MSKTERIFPINTMGGRIQDLRHKHNLTKSELYDLVYTESKINDSKDRKTSVDESKNTTVRNWESGKFEIDYETLKKICKVLNCSADYLLGIDECTNKTAQFIHDETGLSESAINALIKTIKQNPDELHALDYLLNDENNKVFSFLHYLAIYLNNKYTTPLYYDNDKHQYIDVSYQTANGEHGITFGYLTTDNKGNEGYNAIGVSTDLMEQYATIKIQEIMTEWKKNYNREIN